MNRQKREDFEEQIRPLIAEAGYELIGVEVGTEFERPALIVTIDKEGGVSAEDCKKVSRIIDPVLEESDINMNKYMFIVSSPGIEEDGE